MSWDALDPKTRTIAEQELTERQLAILKDRLNGHSWRTIGHAHGIDEATARGHFRRALKRIAHARPTHQPPRVHGKIGEA